MTALISVVPADKSATAPAIEDAVPQSRTADDTAAAPLRTRTIIKTDLPFAATAFRGERDRSLRGRFLLLQDELTFDSVRIVLDDQQIAGVVIGSLHFADHARKMLCEGGKALVYCENLDQIRDNGRYQVDGEGLVDLESRRVPVTAISSYLSEENVALYRDWNVHDLGYFRLKFCLFQMLAADPSAYYSEERIEAHLTEVISDLLGGDWRSVRLVLSDPTSAELREVGIDAPFEANPEIGMRGPRTPRRWWPEVRAIRAALARHPDAKLQVSVPFVSSIEEFRRVVDMFREAGLDRIELGLTLEIPAMVYALPDLLRQCRPAFVAVGTSDLFALLNGVDRSCSELSVDPFSSVNLGVVRDICRITVAHGVHLFVCGELRRNSQTVRELIDIGTGELIASASVREIARMCRVASRDLRP
jgi:phosphotransferase system enzyme I (PtsI)